MSKSPKNILALFALILLVACESESKDNRPNILLIVADDLGYTDIGRFGSEIPTPNLDMLANQGMILTDFYTAPTCSPTRSILFSGTYNHKAGLGLMAEIPESFIPDSRRIGDPGYEGYLNFDVASLGEVMTDAGYNTYMAGKWHLGLTEETSPQARGLQKSFSILVGGAHLGGNSITGETNQARYRDNNELVSVDDDFYSTREYTERMIEFIDSDKTQDKPFFAYLAYTAPHFPLQAPAESIAEFEGQYDQGYEALYRQRLAGMQQQGLLPIGTSEFDSSIFNPAWDSLSAEEQMIEARRMEIYAAMVSDMDKYIGDLISYLKSIDEYDNTFIFFMSDNGAEGNDLNPQFLFNDWIASCCDNSYENMGSGDSYLLYGPNWATASGGPFRGNKSSIYEGGFRVPAFAHYPEGIEANQVNNKLASVRDLMPTFLALAGAEVPGSNYRGRVINPPSGNSLLPVLTGDNSAALNNEYFAFEYYGMQSLRKDDWKIVLVPRENTEWQLFNLAEDPSEQLNIADQNPAVMREMLSLWNDYSREINLPN